MYLFLQLDEIVIFGLPTVQMHLHREVLRLKTLVNLLYLLKENIPPFDILQGSRCYTQTCWNCEGVRSPLNRVFFFFLFRTIVRILKNNMKKVTSRNSYGRNKYDAYRKNRVFHFLFTKNVMVESPLNRIFFYLIVVQIFKNDIRKVSLKKSNDRDKYNAYSKNRIFHPFFTKNIRCVSVFTNMGVRVL